MDVGLKNLEEVNLVCFWVGCAQAGPQREPEDCLHCLWGAHRKCPDTVPQYQTCQTDNTIDSPEKAFQFDLSQMPWLLIFASQSF